MSCLICPYCGPCGIPWWTGDEITLQFDAIELREWLGDEITLEFDGIELQEWSALWFGVIGLQELSASAFPVA